MELCKRIILINKNMLISGVFSVFMAALFVYFAELFTNSVFAMVGSAAIISFILDKIIFLCLHFASMRNYLGKLHRKKIAKDMARLQFHRILLFPLYYVIAVGMHLWLLFSGVNSSLSVLIAYFTALVIARSVHTLYGLRCGLFRY